MHGKYTENKMMVEIALNVECPFLIIVIVNNTTKCSVLKVPRVSVIAIVSQIENKKYDIF